MTSTPALARTYLYVPADNSERLAKATTRGADAVVIDLEDAVAPDHKEQARANLSSWLNQVQTSTQIWVRINNDSEITKDVLCAATPKVTGLLVPKAQDVADTIAYLLSPASGMVTGQTIFVDGGVTIH